MALPGTVIDAAGTWVGTSRLNLSWLPEAERIQTSESTLTLHLSPNSLVAMINYQWNNEDGVQVGSMLLAGDDRQLQAGWMDSWHLNAAVMAMTGPPDQVQLRGTYSVEGHPDWGWGIDFELSEDQRQLTMRMTNISPEGEGEWAVEAVYRKV